MSSFKYTPNLHTSFPAPGAHFTQHRCLLRPPSIFPVIHFTMDNASLKHLLTYIHFQYKQRLTEKNCRRSLSDHAERGSICEAVTLKKCCGCWTISKLCRLAFSA